MKYLIVIPSLILILAIVLIWPANPFNLSELEVIIPEGATLRTTDQILKAQGVLPFYSVFIPAIKIIGAQNKIKAGHYQFSPADPLPEIITKLIIGEVVPVKEIQIIFPEGTSIYKMGEILHNGGFEKWRDFQALVNEGITADLRQKYWQIFKYIPSESLEGYLFPDTYRLNPDLSAAALAEIMVTRFAQVVNPVWEKGIKETTLSLHEILTLASIVDKEAKIPAERSIIASVFYNRLKVGMPLAADPTVKYALERPTKKVYLEQLAVKSPYNTYKRRGLPPGPICNPGLDSIKAVIYPAKTNYFFFVAKKDGSHRFSQTWQEHQRARLQTN